MKRAKQLIIATLAIPLALLLKSCTSESTPNALSNTMFIAPAYSEIMKNFSKVHYKEAENEESEAQKIGDRANLPTPQILEKSLNLHLSAALKGNPIAMYNLGVALEYGNPMEMDLTKAFGWYLLSAKMGFAGAKNNLGDMYEHGQGVEKSIPEAIYWYTQAAMQGEPTAYLSLGTVYKDGIDFKPNLIESAFWLSLAKARLPDGLNLIDASKALEEISKKLTVEEILEINYRAEFFTPLRQTETTISDRPSL